MKKQHQQIGGAAALLLLGVFAACILSVLLLGANVFERLTARDQLCYDERTAVRYLTTRIRQSDVLGGIAIGSFDGTAGEDTLQLTEWIDGEAYVTRIYCCDGYLRELFTEANGEFQPEDGERILEADQVSFRLDDNRQLAIELTAPDQSTATLTLDIRCGKGAAA